MERPLNISMALERDYKIVTCLMYRNGGTRIAMTNGIDTVIFVPSIRQVNKELPGFLQQFGVMYNRNMR
jgi:hypothetical protein